MSLLKTHRKRKFTVRVQTSKTLEENKIQILCSFCLSKLFGVRTKVQIIDENNKLFWDKIKILCFRDIIKKFKTVHILKKTFTNYKLNIVLRIIERTLSSTRRKVT